MGKAVKMAFPIFICGGSVLADLAFIIFNPCYNIMTDENMKRGGGFMA